MSKLSTEQLLGLPPEAIDTLKRTLSYVEYLKVATAILEMRQKEDIDNYNTDLFKTRAKAIENYQEWSSE